MPSRCRVLGTRGPSPSSTTSELEARSPCSATSSGDCLSGRRRPRPGLDVRRSRCSSGPSNPAEPAQPSATATPASARRRSWRTFETNLGLRQPVGPEYGKFVKGIFVGREIEFGSATSTTATAPCLGISYRTKTGHRGAEGAHTRPRSRSRSVARALYLVLGIPVGILAARRRGTVTDKASVSSFLVISLDPLLPVRPARAALPHRLSGRSSRSTGYYPFTENPARGSAGLILPWLVLGISGCTHVRPLHPRLDGRDAQRGLHPHRQGQGPAAAHGDLQARAARRRSCRSSRSSASTSRSCWRARSSPRRSSASTGIGLLEPRRPSTPSDLPGRAGHRRCFGAIFVVIANIVVDILYSVLDPRVRLS